MMVVPLACAAKPFLRYNHTSMHMLLWFWTACFCTIFKSGWLSSPKAVYFLCPFGSSFNWVDRLGQAHSSHTLCCTVLGLTGGASFPLFCLWCSVNMRNLLGINKPSAGIHHGKTKHSELKCVQKREEQLTVVQGSEGNYSFLFVRHLSFCEYCWISHSLLTTADSLAPRSCCKNIGGPKIPCNKTPTKSLSLMNS